MKKLIYTILAVSIIFISCKKDEETNPSTENNDTTATDNNTTVTDTDTTVTDTTVTDTDTTVTDNNAVNTILGVWSTKSIESEMSITVSEGSLVLQEIDTSYTSLPGDEDFPDNLEFTADGKTIFDGDTSSYTYSGNVLIITHEDENEGEVEIWEDTFECVVTATSLKMTSEESGEWEDEFYSYSESYKMTINAER